MWGPPRLFWSAVALAALATLTTAHPALGEASGAEGWPATSVLVIRTFYSIVPAALATCRVHQGVMSPGRAQAADRESGFPPFPPRGPSPAAPAGAAHQRRPPACAPLPSAVYGPEVRFM